MFFTVGNYLTATAFAQRVACGFVFDAGMVNFGLVVVVDRELRDMINSRW